MAQRPDLIASTVVEGRNGAKERWREIGVAFTSESGTITVYLDALPLNGKIILQAPRAREQRE